MFIGGGASSLIRHAFRKYSEKCVSRALRRGVWAGPLAFGGNMGHSREVECSAAAMARFEGVVAFQY